MGKRRQFSPQKEDVQINISPLIDMVFILLIFFIVTTVFVEEEGIDVDKPKAGTESQVSDSAPVMLFVSQNGNIYYDDREIGLSQVRATVAQRIRKETVPVIIEVEPQASSGLMVRVMDEAKKGGAEEISVSAASK